MMSQIAVITMPDRGHHHEGCRRSCEFGHGEIEARPKPDPRASRISDNAAMAKAPPMIAAHEIAQIDDSKPSSAAPAPIVRIRSRERIYAFCVPRERKMLLIAEYH